MITNKKGNLVTALLEGDVDVLLHQANCRNTMASGIAKEIRERIPEAYEEDTMYHKCGWATLGESSMACHVVNGKSTGRLIFNLYGQEGFNLRSIGRPDTIYWALFKAMTDAKKLLKGKKIGIPKLLGCGLGGGDWKLVKHFIEVEYADLDVYIYEYKPEEKE